MVRKIAAAVLAAVLVPALALPVFAAPEDDPVIETVFVDPGYSGPLDPYTGLPLTNDKDTGSFYSLKDGEFGYDRDSRCYVNEVGDLSFSSNIPNGAVLSAGQTASITIPTGLSATLFRNGNEVTDMKLTEITESGSYLVEVISSGFGDSASFSFQILRERSNALHEFILPSGFSFESVLINGDMVTPEYSNYMELIEDGEYRITWACPDIDQRFVLTFIRDVDAPVLALPQVVDGQAHSPVTLTDLEENAYIYLECDGETKTIVSPSTEIKDAGTYTLTVYDQAGNSTQYNFTIHFYLNLSAAAAISMLLAAIVGLSAYSRHIKKHPRVG